MIGETLGGHYRIESKLGEGGMGVVYKARDAHLDRPVAAKLLLPDAMADPRRRERFVREAKAASALNRPNIVTIHEIRSDDSVDYIVMEYVQGQTLDRLLPLRPAQALKYAVQMADAFAKAHAAGILHRDIKPSNVMVTDDGRVKILDFGLAKLAEPAEIDPDAPTLRRPSPRRACSSARSSTCRRNRPRGRPSTPAATSSASVSSCTRW